MDMSDLLIEDIVLLNPIYKYGELNQSTVVESLVQNF